MILLEITLLTYIQNIFQLTIYKQKIRTTDTDNEDK